MILGERKKKRKDENPLDLKVLKSAALANTDNCYRYYTKLRSVIFFGGFKRRVVP